MSSKGKIDLKASLTDQTALNKTIERAAAGADQAAPRPQGRPRKEGPRPIFINTAYDVDNYEFIKNISALNGRSFTSFVNEMIRAYRTPEREKFVEEYKKKVEAMTKITFPENKFE